LAREMKKLKMGFEPEGDGGADDDAGEKPKGVG
jgi:hypothetical protein